MAIIKKQKGKVVLSAILGALFMGILCGGIFFVYTQKVGILPSKLLKMEENLEQSVVVQLSRNIAEGTILSKEDLKELTVQVPKGSIEEQSLSFYEGKCLKISLDQGSILSSKLIYKEQKVADDERLLNLSYVRLSEKMRIGDYVDIRISFRNGGDYILLSKKKIQDISGNHEEKGGEEENALWLQVNEEEILRLASAVVDSYYQEGCEIYAISYISEMQKAAVVTYPVNETVKKLLGSDPNIIFVAQGKGVCKLSEDLSKELRDNIKKEIDKEDSRERLDNIANQTESSQELEE